MNPPEWHWIGTSRRGTLHSGSAWPMLAHDPVAGRPPGVDGEQMPSALQTVRGTTGRRHWGKSSRPGPQTPGAPARFAHVTRAWWHSYSRAAAAQAWAAVAVAVRW